MPFVVPESCESTCVVAVTPVPVTVVPGTMMPEATAVTVITEPVMLPVNEDVAGAMAPVTLAPAGSEVFSAVAMSVAAEEKLVADERLSEPAENV